MSQEKLNVESMIIGNKYINNIDIPVIYSPNFRHWGSQSKEIILDKNTKLELIEKDEKRNSLVFRKVNEDYSKDNPNININSSMKTYEYVIKNKDVLFIMIE